MIRDNNFLKTLIKRYYGKGNIPYKLMEEPYFPWQSPDSAKIKKFRDSYKGQSCVVIGNGPSLNKHDLSLIEEVPSFGVNGIFYKTRQTGFKPHFYVVEDSHVMKDNYAEIDSYDVSIKFFPIEYKRFIKNRDNCIFFKMNQGFYVEHSPNFKIPRFSTDCSEKIFCGQSVTMINLQLAYYMGFSTVYLIGMDFNYDIPNSAVVNGNDIISQDADTNHFHPDYFGAGKVWHNPHLDRVLNSYKMMKLIYEIDGRRILNASIGGKLEVFDRVSYDDVFSQRRK